MSFVPLDAQFGYMPVEFEIPTEAEQLKEFIAQRERMTADLMNVKENGQYETYSAGNTAFGETVTGQRWFTVGNNAVKRDCFRKVIDFGALPNAGVKTVAHHIQMDDGTTLLVTQVVEIRCVAYDPTIGAELAIPIPYIDPAGNNIAISMDNTNIIITTTSNRTNFTKCYVVLEYLRT